MREGAPTPQTLQDPILLTPWVCFRILTRPMGRDYSGNYTSVSVIGEEAYFTELGASVAYWLNSVRAGSRADWAGSRRILCAGLTELVRMGMCMFLNDTAALKVSLGPCRLSDLSLLACNTGLGLSFGLVVLYHAEGGGDVMVFDMENTPSWQDWLSRVSIG